MSNILASLRRAFRSDWVKINSVINFGTHGALDRLDIDVLRVPRVTNFRPFVSYGPVFLTFNTNKGKGFVSSISDRESYNKPIWMVFDWFNMPLTFWQGSFVNFLVSQVNFLLQGCSINGGKCNEKNEQQVCYLKNQKQDFHGVPFNLLDRVSVVPSHRRTTNNTFHIISSLIESCNPKARLSAAFTNLEPAE